MRSQDPELFGLHTVEHGSPIPYILKGKISYNLDYTQSHTIFRALTSSVQKLYPVRIVPSMHYMYMYERKYLSLSKDLTSGLF